MAKKKQDLAPQAIDVLAIWKNDRHSVCHRDGTQVHEIDSSAPVGLIMVYCRYKSGNYHPHYFSPDGFFDYQGKSLSNRDVITVEQFKLEQEAKAKAEALSKL